MGQYIGDVQIIGGSSSGGTIILGVNGTELSALPSTAGDNSLVAAPSAGSQIRLLQFLLVATGGANSYRWRKGAAGTFLDAAAIPLAANEKVVFDFNGLPWYSFGDAKAMVLNLSAATAVSFWGTYLVTTP